MIITLPTLTFKFFRKICAVVITTISTFIAICAQVYVCICKGWWLGLFWTLIAWFYVAWWLDWCQKLSLISWSIYSLLRWAPTFYSIQRWVCIQDQIHGHGCQYSRYSSDHPSVGMCVRVTVKERWAWSMKGKREREDKNERELRERGGDGITISAEWQHTNGSECSRNFVWDIGACTHAHGMHPCVCVIL